MFAICEDSKDFNISRGVYVLDMNKMAKGVKVNHYRLFELTKEPFNFNFDSVSNMISLHQKDCLKSFYRPHVLSRNLISFEKIRAKNDYLIWREKNHFFTAVDVHNKLFTWSMFTGELLYEKQLSSDALIEDAMEYRSFW